MSNDPADLYVAHDLDLRRIHAALMDKLGELAEATGVLAEKTIFVCRALLWHHHAESTILFPRLRRAGRLRSADVSFLDACEREHRALHTVCQQLLSKAEGPHLDALDAAALASDLSSQFSLHIVEEEAGLAPDRLREMITPDGLLAIAREVEASRPR